jgi:hypothetical protein
MHYVSAIKISRLMLFKEKNGSLLWEPYDTHKYILLGTKQNFSMLKQVTTGL